MSDDDLIQKGQDDLIRRVDALDAMNSVALTYGATWEPHSVKLCKDAISAIPAASATQHDFVQPTVRPLVWRTIQDKYDGGREHYGTGAFGHWYCVHRRKSGVWDIVHHVDGKPIHFEPCDTIEAAKAAAQADYDTRIRSALTAQPSPDVAALVEAADKLLDAYSAIVGAGNPWGDELRVAIARVKGGA